MARGREGPHGVTDPLGKHGIPKDPRIPPLPSEYILARARESRIPQTNGKRKGVTESPNKWQEEGSHGILKGVTDPLGIPCPRLAAFQIVLVIAWIFDFDSFSLLLHGIELS